LPFDGEYVTIGCGFVQRSFGFLREIIARMMEEVSTSRTE
jgi:hypothetical protein